MKNYKKLIGIIALTVIIGFSFTACGGGGGAGGGGGDTIVVNSTTAGATITGLSSFNNNYIFGFGTAGAVDLYLADSITTGFSITGKQISSGSASLNVWRDTGVGDDVVLSNYTGSGSVTLVLMVINKATIDANDVNNLFIHWYNSGPKPSFLVSMITVSGTATSGNITGAYIP